MSYVVQCVHNVSNITKTQSGTLIVDGVEYNQYPAPQTLLKIMQRQWAEQLVIGSVRFGSLEYYRRWENKVLGDPNDGNGMFRMNDHPYSVQSSNNIYAFCTALPIICCDRIRVLAQHGNYSCIVRIQSIDIFIQRIRDALQPLKGRLILHCSAVNYNRGSEVDKPTLNSQRFHFNVFQKSSKFAEDKEYRLALTDYQIASVDEEFVDLKIGDCSDIMEIETLPN